MGFSKWRVSLLVGVLTASCGWVMIGTVEPARASHNWTGYHYHCCGTVENPIRVRVWSGNTDSALSQMAGLAADDPTHSWSAYTAIKFDFRGSTPLHKDGCRNCNVLHYAETPPGVLGWANSYLCAGTIHEICYSHMHITDRHDDLYKGTGDAPYYLWDLWSIVSHEMGHWIRLGDLYDSDSSCPNSSSRGIMCSPLYQGTERQRTPNQPEEIASALVAATAA